MSTLGTISLILTSEGGFSSSLVTSAHLVDLLFFPRVGIGGTSP